MNLQEFIRLPHRFEWGGSGMPDADGAYLNDCHTICASWALMQTGLDPSAPFRGTYGDATGARAIIDAAGGSVLLFDGQLMPLGYERVMEPRDGDIGVVMAPVGIDEEFRQIGGIRFGPLWACLGKGGLVAKRLEYVAAWRFEK